MPAPSTLTSSLDATMQRASEALVRMDYLECESLCLHALAKARRAEDWAYYARILMPLQEARRQRRMTAAEGAVYLGTASMSGGPADWLDHVDAGCIVVTRPNGPADARKLNELATERRRFVEVLLAACDASEPTWMLSTFKGPQVTCAMPAPPRAWLKNGTPAASSAPAQWLTPADWFLDAAERLGDAALATVDAALRGTERVAALEACLNAVTDHEILHQRLFDAAQAAARGE